MGGFVLYGVEDLYQIHTGNAIDILPNLPVVHTVLTSPPYFDQRNYGDDPREHGQEKEINVYIANLVSLFNAINLHPLGSVWVNLGDTRSGELLQVPELFACEMRVAGWKLIDRIIWAKVAAENDGKTTGHCMIEPATGRFNGNGYEFLFRFSKCKVGKAWFDQCAVSLPRAGVSDIRYLPSELMETHTSVEGRVMPNVWRVSLESYTQEHYAPYPAALCERPIASCCPMNVCTVCGHLRTRIVEKEVYVEEGKDPEARIFGKYTKKPGDPDFQKKAGRQDAGRHYVPKKPVTKGWLECEHKAYTGGIVLDPYCGSGTTGKIALSLGRRFIGIDLYQNYADMSVKRCQDVLNELDAKKLYPAELEK
jgi:DNA modification methylase